MKISHILWSSLLLLLFLTGFSCKQESTSITGNGGGPSPSQKDTIPINYPTQIGSQWTYLVFDSLQLHQDTVWVSIVDTTRLQNGQKAYIWRYIYPDRIDSDFVSIRGDTIDVYLEQDTLTLFFRYISPLWVGKSWVMPVVTDSVKVLSKDTLAVSAGIFYPTFSILWQFYYFHYTIEISGWYVPGIGIIKRREIIYTLGIPGKYTLWELLDYSPPSQ
ncbi:MAG: hypothetical protein D6681_15075 [Calditrichaeota bacterium]|nr:MAG: hypothetical protein D6681_15075 [Calditrichota bacterium]